MYIWMYIINIYNPCLHLYIYIYIYYIYIYITILYLYTYDSCLIRENNDQ